MINKKGFTLIEVISVLVILGLIATLVVTQYSNIIKDSRKQLNDEQKSRLVEVAKNVSLNNKECLQIAKDNEAGSKITIDQMKKNGYIANTDLKDLEKNSNLDACVIINWDSIYQKFNYQYSEECNVPKNCIITAESEKVIISSFNFEGGNYTNQQSITYNLQYSARISADYCITLENEASCNWKKLNSNLTSLSGNINITKNENIVHLYVRNSNKNIINSIDRTIYYDTVPPTCVWQSAKDNYIKNGGSTEIVLSCNDPAGIDNVTLLSSTISYNNSLISLSDAIVTENANGKDYKFSILGLTGNGEVTLSLNSGVLKDKAGNAINTTLTSSSIVVDNISPTADIKINESNYTNSEFVTLYFSNASDVDKMCISNTSGGNCSFVAYASSYPWTLSTSDGTKTVYVTFRDRAGNEATKTASIVLDKTAPICTSSASSSINSIKENAYVDYTINCVDDNFETRPQITTDMLLIDNPNLADIEVLGTNTSGTKIRVTAKNGNGNMAVYLTPSIEDKAKNKNIQKQLFSINIDNTPPSNNSISFKYDKMTITNLNYVNLVLSSDLLPNEGYYCLKLEDDISKCTNSNWEVYKTNVIFDVSHTDGTYNIYVFFKDIAGNVSPNSVSKSIKINHNAIQCELKLEDDRLFINSTSNNLAATPYFINGEWTTQNYIPIANNQTHYFAYIKDNNNEINYCEYDNT